MGLAFVGLATAILVSGDNDADNQLATVASLFVGIASLLVALTDFFRQEPSPSDPAAYADDLALTIRAQWLEEAESRRLRDPRVLPLVWTTTSRPVADEPRPGAAGGRVLRVRLDGRLDGRFDEVIAQLASGYGRLAGGRLVVIGEPGAGKTVLALLLALGLLGTREPGDPVPVLLPVSSWDPVRERLDDWIVRTLALPYYNGRPEIPRTLLTHGLLVPVLDGLDEIPESARRSAIRGINNAIGGERPVVVTCRATEYEDLIRGGAPTLRRTPVVEISPVPPGDVVAYLREVDWPPGTDWSQVFARLHAEPRGPLAAALSTPLMVTSARLVYQRGGGDPGELLHGERFDCRYAVEDHLMHRLVDAAYAPDPALPEETRGQGRWTAEQARGWLTFLACHLHDHRERDLAWWQMSERLLSRWAGPMVGVGAGGALALASVTVIAVSGTEGVYARNLALTALIFGGAFALLCTMLWYATAGRPPGRLSLTLAGSIRRLWRGFGSGVALAGLSVLPVLAATAVINALPLRGFAVVELYCRMFMVAVWLAVVVGLALAAHNWLNAPPARAARSSPAETLAQDRRSAVTGALLAGLVVGTITLPSWYAGVLSGALLPRLLTGWMGWPGEGRVARLASRMEDELRGLFNDDVVVMVCLSVLTGVVFALLVLLTRAWPRFLLLSALLALRGQLPWRLMAFLADARRRELLRQSSGTYQFRHVRLQEALAGDLEQGEEQWAGGAAPAGVGRRVLLAGGAVAAVGVLSAVSWTAPRDMSRRVSLASPGFAGMAFQPGSHLLFARESSGQAWLWDADRRHRMPLPGLSVPGPVTFDSGGRLLTMDPVTGGMSFRTVSGGVVPEDGWTSVQADLLRLVLRPDEGELVVFLDVGARGESSGPMVEVRPVDARGRVKEPPEGPQEIAYLTVDLAVLKHGDIAVLTEWGEIWRYRFPDFTAGTRPLPRGLSSDLQGKPRAMEVSSYDGSITVLGSKASELWRGDGRDRVWKPVLPLTAASAAAFSPAGPLLATGDDSGLVRLWSTDAHRRPPKELTGHTGRITSACFSSDGQWLATASDDGTVRLWDDLHLP
ncbi:NACHT domain-containing protein [Streptomyces phaeochromogenes]|uniref:NACHT domain-containing protein n=1 Tax=Streptomyces phaeochromogenes TaxID=1923 RepID=A0ABZ1HFH1_STRPH|nr:NACHT domain-containing protein [Streptomyces phaeochromogenes]WSD17352.1 NACHT domain-containing protein [Streptomyces phaeochromogenes]